MYLTMDFICLIFQRNENELTKRRVFAESAAQDGYAGVEA